MTDSSYIPKINLADCAALAVGLALAVLLAFVSGDLDIVKKAAGIGETPEGLGRFVNVANSLITPIIIAMAAICPIAALGGFGVMMFGSKKGLIIVAAALGSLVGAVSVKGIVA